jgi:hypothetical protein
MVEPKIVESAYGSVDTAVCRSSRMVSSRQAY